LFGNNATPSLFTNLTNTSSLFGSKPLFNFSSLGDNTNKDFFKGNSKKESDGEDGEGDDNDLFQPSSSPNAYNPTDDSNKGIVTEKSVYTKKYVKQIENLYVFHKEENKFVSKGTGFLSLEFADVDGKRVGVVVFRNTMGNKIIEGFLTTTLKAVEKYVKNFKHVIGFKYLHKTKEKLELGKCKIPFPREDELKEFEKCFNEVIQLLDSSSSTPQAGEKKDDKQKETKKD